MDQVQGGGYKTKTTTRSRYSGILKKTLIGRLFESLPSLY